MKTKQVFVVLSGLSYALGVGFALGMESVLIDALFRGGFHDNADGAVPPASLSFLHISKNLASGAAFLIIAIVMQIFGRKVAHIVLNLSLIVSLILFILAKHISVVYLAQVIQGISDTGIFVEAIILCEFCHKKHRGIFMSMEKVAEWIGIFICHLSHNFISWRMLYMIGIVPPCVAIALTIFWPESPYFHAMNGKYEECENSFYLLHGESEKQRRELQSIVTAEQKKQENQKRSSVILNTFRKFLDKNFWKTFFIVNTVLGFYLSITLWSEYLAAFSTYNFYKIFHISDKLYHSSMYIFKITLLLLSCSIMMIERRIVLFVFGFISILISFITSLLISGDVDNFSEISFNVAMLSIINILFVMFSVLPVSAILVGELYFLEHRGIGMFASGIVFAVLQLILTVSFVPLGFYSGFNYVILNSAWIAAFCLIILFFTLPETKDKTLHEIEDELRGVKRSVNDKVPFTPANSVEMGQLLHGEVQDDNIVPDKPANSVEMGQ